MSETASARDLILAPATGMAPLAGFPGAFVREILISESEYIGRLEQDAGYRLIMLLVVDETGKPIFGEDDLDKLKKLPARTFRKISEQVTEASGLVDKDIEEAKKN